MAAENKSNALAQFGPVVAPLVGVVLLVVFIAIALVTSSVSKAKDDLAAKASATRANLDSTAVVIVPGKTIPLADNVTNTFKRDGTNNWQADPGNRTLLALPVKWEVTMEMPEGDLFAKMDENQDGFIDPMEFTRNMPPEWAGTMKDKFDNWDRNPKDGLISRAEFDDPPRSDQEAFNELDKNGDGKLTAKDGEISSENERAWDSYPYDGSISPEEYVDRYKPRAERALGPVRDVEVQVDAATMEIVVTWTDPDITPKPDDISFIIERRAPQTVAKREAAWRKEMIKFSSEQTEWDRAFDDWWGKPSATDTSKTNKQVIPDRNKAKDEFAKTKSRPVEPEKPSEWEIVAGPVPGNEYRDKSFEPGVTYTYAVFMATQSKPMRAQKVRELPRFPGWFLYIERQPAAGHPVIVRNRVEMNWAGAAPPNGNLQLTTWYKVTAGDDIKWYRAQIVEPVEPGSVVGNLYNMAALNTRKLKLFDVAGVELVPADILPADAEIDFRSGFNFVAIGARNAFLLNSSDLGDFEVQRNVQGPPAAPDQPSINQDAVEVRALTVKNGGKDATFELTRWLKVKDTWVRIELRTAVKVGAEIGREIQLDKPGEGVTVFDDAGATRTDLKAFKDIKVELRVGKFDSVDGRAVTVAGTTFDLFGTLYKE